MNRLIVGLLLLGAPVSLLAAEYICSDNGVTRTISVDYQNDPEPLPCRVKYDKPQEGGVQYPWNAQNQVGFCEQKAAALADRLRSYGWDCERQQPEIGEMPEETGDAAAPMSSRRSADEPAEPTAPAGKPD